MTSPPARTQNDSAPMSPVDGSGTTRLVVIGDESLAIACAEISRDAGLDVVALVSRNRAVAVDRGRTSASRRSIFVTSPAQPRRCASFASTCSISAANLRVLSADVLAQARTSINFHDGPLPGYAGLNVTTWAIHNGESEHGVAWHLITSDIDGGDIVAESRFEIRADETAFSLNARCYEEATATFPAIAAALAAGTLTSTPQRAGDTKMYRRRDRPHVFLDPDLPADETARRARSLDVGLRVDNTIGAARIVVGGTYYVANEVAAVERSLAGRARRRRGGWRRRAAHHVRRG